MADDILFVGLDVHKKTISVAVVAGEPGASCRYYGAIAHTPEALRRLCKKLKADGAGLYFCYEAGPCGYGVQRLLTRWGHRCDVVAPTLIPRKAGDRVKNDRRDAMSLAQNLRAGHLLDRLKWGSGYRTRRTRRCASWCALRPWSPAGLWGPAPHKGGTSAAPVSSS